MKQRTGFTLIEVMIVVLILAVLAAIAYPSYTRYMARSHVSAAQAYLMDYAQRQQQYLLDNRGYATQAQLVALDPIPTKVDADYTFNQPDPGTTPPTFTVTATPKSTSVVAKYGGSVYNQALSIDNAGAKSPAALWQ